MKGLPTCVVLAFAVVVKGQPLSFEGMGSLPGQTGSEVYRVSGDGSTAVGRAHTAARWTRSTGWQTVGANAASIAYGASANGSVVAGQDYAPATGSFAFRWSDSGGYQGLGSLVGVSGAYGVSPDGSTVVGAGTPPASGELRGYRVRGSSAEFLAALPGYEGGSAKATSTNGDLVTGWAYQGSGHFRAVRWDASGAVSDLGVLPGTVEGRAYDCSADGLIVVGHSFTPSQTNHAVRWTPSGIDDLGTLMPDFQSSAYGVSADGDVVVGGSGGGSGGHAFLWTSTLGMVDLETYLRGLGMNLSTWRLLAARGVSADGSTIVGNGINPAGVYESWIAVIPGPAGATVLLWPILARRPSRQRA